MTRPAHEPLTISQRLSQLADDAEGDAVTLDWILGQLHERAFGLFLLVLALPCCIPFLYGVPQIVALPLMFISGQILLGRTSPWLPGKLGLRTVAKTSLAGLAHRAGPWLRRIEALSRPRLASLTRAPLDRVVGLALVVFSISILVPLPGTNTVPGIAVVIVAMGLLQRDGILVILGAALGMAWIGTLLLAGATVVSLIADGWDYEGHMQNKHLITLAALGSLGLLAAAFAFQHLGGLQPCTMCLWQRWPHAAAVALGGIAVVLPGAALPVALTGALAMAISAGIALLHTGVERAWWTINLTCTGGQQGLSAMDVAALLDPTQGTGIVLCTDVAWSLMGLSMASWNGIASLALAAIWVVGLLRVLDAHGRAGVSGR